MALKSAGPAGTLISLNTISLGLKSCVINFFKKKQKKTSVFWTLAYCLQIDPNKFYGMI